MDTDHGTLTWGLWIDFQAEDTTGLTPALVEPARPGITLDAGSYVLVGSEDSELAVARVISVEPDGLVYTRVLPGPTSEHMRLVGTTAGA